MRKNAVKPDPLECWWTVCGVTEWHGMQPYRKACYRQTKSVHRAWNKGQHIVVGLVMRTGPSSNEMVNERRLRE